MRGADPEPGAALARHAKVGAEVEQAVLDAGQQRVLLALGMEAEQADCGVRLVHRAYRVDARGVLAQAGPVAERGFTAVAAARGDDIELHHGRFPLTAA